MWINHADCKRLIQEAWSIPVQGCPMTILRQKLKNVKTKIKEWNKTVFGNIQLRVENAMSAVESIQQQINSDGATDDLMQQELLAQMDLEQALKFEEEFRRRKLGLIGTAMVIGTQVFSIESPK